MSNYPAPTTDTAISGLFPIPDALTVNDLLIISIKLTEGYYTGRVTLEQIRQFFLNHTTALEISGLINLLDGKSNTDHKHVAADITDMTSVLATKANTIHTHTTAQITGLGSLLDGKANIVHTHEISSINGLLSALQAKAPSIHTHGITDVFGLKEKLDELESWTIAGGSNHTHQITQVVGLEERLSQKADTEHNHGIENITGLQEELNNKATLSHTHGVEDIENIDATLSQKADLLHNHNLSDIVGITAAMDGKANTAHTHSIDSIDGLLDELDKFQVLTEQLGNKADTIHTHQLMDVSGLDEALTSKANVLHKHGIDDVTGLRDGLNARAPTEHTHLIPSIDGLDLALNNKSDLGHSHQISQVDGLEDALGAKADDEHTHLTEHIVDFADVMLMKADTNHSHPLSQVDGLVSALADAEKVSNRATTLENPSDTHYPSVTAVVNGISEIMQNYNYPVMSINGARGDVVINKEVLGLANVDNTTDMDKPASTATLIELSKKVDRKLMTFDPDSTPGRVTAEDDYVTIIQKLQWQIDVLRGLLVTPLENAVSIVGSGDTLTFVFEKDVKFRNVLISQNQFNVKTFFQELVQSDVNTDFPGINHALIEVLVVDKTLTIKLLPNWISPAILAQVDSVDQGGTGTGILNYEADLVLKNLISIDGSLTNPISTAIDLTVHTNLSERSIPHDDKVYERAVVLGTWGPVPVYSYVSPDTLMDVSAVVRNLIFNFDRIVLINGVEILDYTGTPSQFLSDVFVHNSALTAFLPAFVDEFIEIVKQEKGFTIKLSPGFIDPVMFGQIDIADTASGIQTIPLEVDLVAVTSIDGEDIVPTRVLDINLTAYTNISSSVTTHTVDDYAISTIVGRFDDQVRYEDIPGIPVSDLAGGYSE